MNVALHPQPLNFISLCTGGGGLDLGIGLALPDAHAVVLVEREAFAVGHLVAAIEQGLMAPAAIWSDVRTFDGRPWRGIVDGLIGGIPCQPHSLAGKRLGEEDERDLWSDARRIVVQSRPWLVVIENVEGMLTSGGAERVVRDLRRLRYTVEIGLFSASETGASHQRNRVFIVAVADSASSRFIGWEDSGTDRSYAGEDGRRGAQSQRGGRELADAIDPRLERYGRDVRDGDQSRWLDARAERSTGPRSVSVVNPTIERRREGRTEPEFRSGRDTAAGASSAVADANLPQLRQEPSAGQLAQLQPDDGTGEADLGSMADASGGLVSIERRGPQGRNGIGSAGALFPPGPSDFDGWRRVLEDSPDLEPALRRMADGLASKLDAARIERLRMLGNGVVCLEAAYAIRTLLARLAADGSPAAAFLIRMMEEAA